MNMKTTILLVLLLLVVAAAVLVVEWRGGPGAGSGPATGGGAIDGVVGDDEALLKAGEVSLAAETRIILERADGLRWVIEGRALRWSQVEPVRFPVDPRRVADLLDTIARTSVVKVLDERDASTAEERERAALSQPVARVRIEQIDAGGDPIVIELGRQLRTGRGYARRVGRGQVLLVEPDMHKALLEDNWTSLRVRTLGGLAIPRASQAEHVVIEREAAGPSVSQRDRIVVKRAQAGQWRFDGAGGGRVSREALDELLDAVRRTAIVRFPTDEDTRDGEGLGDADNQAVVAMPRVTLEVRAAGGEDDGFTLTFGRSADAGGKTRYAEWTPIGGESVAMVLPGSLADAVVEALEPDHLRDMTLCPWSSAEVVAIEREDASGRSELRRDGAEWDEIPAAAAAISRSPDASFVGSLLDMLTELEARSVVSLSDADGMPPDRPADRTFTLRRAGDDTGYRVRWWQLPGETSFGLVEAGARDGASSPVWLAVAEDEAVGYVFSDAAVDLAVGPVDLLRDRSIFELGAERITRVAIERRGGEMVLAAPGSSSDAGSDGWRVQAAGRSWPVEREAAAALLDAVVRIEAVRWIEARRAPAWFASQLPAEANAGAASSPASAAMPETLPASGLKVTIETDAGRRLTLLVDEPSRIIRAISEPTACMMSARFVQAVSAELRRRTLVDLPSTSIRELSMFDAADAPGASALVLSRLGATAIAQRGGEAETVNTSAVFGLFDALGGLRAQRYLAEAPHTNPARRITLSALDGRRWLIHIWPPSETSPAIVEVNGQPATVDAHTAAALLAPIAAGGSS